MKRLSVFFLMVVMLFSVTSAYAAPLPERAGSVTDPVGIFSPEEQERIAAAAANQKYEVLLLTASGLDEQEGEQLANQAYDAWKLGPNQLMLVVTVNPNHVHLVFENQQLADLVSRSDASDVKGILDQQFVPQARDGNLAEGVIAVSEFVNGLSAAASSPEGSGGSGAATQPSGSSQSSSPPTVSHTPSRSSTTPSSSLPVTANAGGGNNGLSAGLIVGLLLIAILLFFVVKQLVFRSRLNKLLTQVKEKHTEVTPVIDQMIVSELFRELEIGLIEGETKKRATQLEQEALKLHKESQQLKEQLDTQKIGFFSTAKTEQAVAELMEAVDKYAAEITDTQAQMSEMERLSREVREAVEAAKERAKEIGALIEALARETSFSLSVMRKDMEQTLALLNKADSMDEFDYLQAEEPAKQVHAQFDSLQLAVEEVRLQIRQHQEFPPRIKSREEELRLIVGREQLLLVDADPFAILRAAEAEIPRLGGLIEAGDTKEAKACAQRVENGLQEASEVVAAMIRHRDFAKETVRDISQLLAELQDFDPQYAQELSRLQQQYAEVHLREQDERYSQIMEDKSDLERLLMEIKAAIDERAQRYRLAFEKSETAQQLLSRVKNTREQSLGYRQSLEDRVRTASERFQNQESRFYQAASLFDQLRVRIPDISRMISHIKSEAADIEALANSARIDVYQLEDAISSFTSQVDQLVHRVDQVRREKEETMRAFQKLQDDYVSRRNRYGGKIKVSRYAAQFDQLRDQVDGAVAEGLFAEAMSEITNGREILRQMEREYQRKLDEERRRRNNNSGGFGGGMGGGLGGGFGGGRSSGSSGWGGGGRSSGSSSWGGSSGGSRSSGSSSW
ncbi:TPM domain-containing protein [Brevibacillus ruminantium]|uniref:TPM domain-containing protein n=1 Tax=Brevibacillus ruminantium TaxID=2950604 RepID=A0ABY4WJR2_9BACL|nr:septation ring formation regulator EzrA [Brevibacillus ruminantium]USG65599.1 TPM domain-containing protein [Brevibacillus ruminantium]